MSQKIDRIGQRFGRLTVIAPAPRVSGHPYWVCQCDDGRQLIVAQSNLLNGHVQSCGCFRREMAAAKRSLNLVGMRFGRLTVLARTEPICGVAAWSCTCDCGNFTAVRTNLLTSGVTKSCGCLKRIVTSKRSLHDLTGQTFHRLTVICRGPNTGHHVQWMCRCVCDKITLVEASKLVSGLTKSCGCIRSEIPTLHTDAKLLRLTKNSWGAMKQRCTNPNAPGYIYYGGRGITFDPKWVKFKNFVSDVGIKPSEFHSLDRYPDPHGHYMPGNVRWATKTEQAQNRRKPLAQFIPSRSPSTGRFSSEPIA